MQIHSAHRQAFQAARRMVSSHYGTVPHQAHRKEVHSTSRPKHTMLQLLRQMLMKLRGIIERCQTPVLALSHMKQQLHNF